MSSLSWIRLRVPPSDLAVVLLLALSVVVAAVRLPFVHPAGELVRLLVIQIAMFLGFTLTVAAMIRWEAHTWVRFVRPLATINVVFTCYTTLGELGMAALPYRSDGWLSQADTLLLGFNPTFAVEPYLTPGRIEFFAFFYAAFIPYIYVTLALNCLGQPVLVREQFLTGWVILYFISFLGYLFMPGAGPAVYHASEYAAPIDDGFFWRLVRDGVESTGGMQGAFPSLHVGCSLYLCLFELKVNRLRGLIYLPLVLLIYAATVVLRYHYVIDLVVGTVLAAGCLPLGPAVFRRWAERREAAGLPALPGGEGDVLPDFPPAGAGNAPPVFSAN